MGEKRKKQLVHRDIQLALVKRLVLQWLIFVAATCLITFVYLYLMDPLQGVDALVLRTKAMMMAALTVSLCLAPIFVRDSIRLSHRVVGPVLRLQQAIRQTNVDIPNDRIRLRANDYWQDVAEDYNQLLGRIEQGASVDRQST